MVDVRNIYKANELDDSDPKKSILSYSLKKNKEVQTKKLIDTFK